jgi:hypothetical protein
MEKMIKETYAIKDLHATYVSLHRHAIYVIIQTDFRYR